jgi:molybdopterin-guanine dinucleotide biosynthesis protein A
MDDTIGAIILAGGQSRRMGHNKALLRLAPEGPRLIELALAAARTIASEPVLSTNTPDAYAWLGLPIVADAVPDAGPLAGLAAGLAALASEWALLVGCDMPTIAPDLLRLLVAYRQGAQAVVPLNQDDRPEPLCALYHRSCLPVIQDRLASGDYAMMAWLPLVVTHYIPTAEVRAVDPTLRSFRNLNTPADLQE